MSPFPKKSLTVGGEDPFLPSLLAAINHATEISIAVAFIRFTGVLLIENALVDAIKRGAHVRILTGDYLGITDPKALRYLLLLQEMGADVKVFESGGKHSFHMKAYLFNRTDDIPENEGCAFIGSSNISKSALESGLEWNLKIDKFEDEKRFEKIMDEYNLIYMDARSKNLTNQWIDDYIKRIPSRELQKNTEAGADEQDLLPSPNEIQSEALDALNETREKGYRRGLVVMATGLGKTWLAAFDCQHINAKRVLFVAHREEILNQAEETYVRIRPDLKVGRYNGRVRELNVDMLFASIQTLGKAKHLEQFAKDHFDYIVVDEFHHAAARTYQLLLSHFSPRFLLGLTATPERTDQSDILTLCDNNLVYSKDLYDGIRASLLSPFHYYGVGDIVDYQEISWRNGKFDESELVNQLATTARAKHNLKYWQKYQLTRTLAFCISIKHADFMSSYFNRHGVTAVSVHSNSTTPRNAALSQLKNGEIQIIFSVDLFNEGVDLPAIDTVLMLRPTESKIIFLQQLGRGLRTSPGKEKLVVLDFIGNHISFFRKPEALFQIGVTNKERKNFIEKLKTEALELPPGCFVNYDLQSIEFMQKLVGTNVDQQLAVYLALKESYARRPTLAEFYRAGGGVDTIRQEHGQWLALVNDENDLDTNEKKCFLEFSNFYKTLEITNLTKSFKLILLEALLELEGFESSPTTQELAIKSFEVLQRRRPLLVDLPTEFQNIEKLNGDNSKHWHRYWLNNPIKAWTGGNKKTTTSFFSVVEEHFRFLLNVPKGLYNAFVVLAQEIINYRFLQYEARLSNKDITTNANVFSFEKNEEQEIPYFSDLRIACGHFRTSQHETDNIEHRSLPISLGKLDPVKHFIARASGDSMNGGLHPIRSGDYLLLEVITPNNAGSNDGRIIAIEQQDVTGDDQYLLRKIKKIAQNEYQLIAQNPDYPPMLATEEMNTFARFKQVLDVTDIYLHHEIYKQDVSEIFGLEYKEGVWKMPGHVCPSGSNDQFLFVTLNKQRADANYRYNDYFIDKSHFHWQSQNSTTPQNKKGLRIINSNNSEGSIYLFVRKFPKVGGKTAPFIFCGRLSYGNHSGSAPISVEFELDNELTPNLCEMFLN
jgi:superfamily II DNA or RNA helicase/SOS-response transcriptional repressor LexA